VNVTVKVPEAVGEMSVIAGASGVVVGVPAMEALASPPPWVFTARIITEYSVPFVNPEIVSGLPVVPVARFVHVVPPSNEYWYVVIAEAPGLDGAVKATFNAPLAVVTDVMVGAVAYGLTIESSEATNPLEFTPLTDATRKRTFAPGVNPGIDAVVSVDVPSFTQRHVAPPSSEYCIT
jgi:hypothetical protein